MTGWCRADRTNMAVATPSTSPPAANASCCLCATAASLAASSARRRAAWRRPRVFPPPRPEGVAVPPPRGGARAPPASARARRAAPSFLKVASSTIALSATVAWPTVSTRWGPSYCWPTWYAIQRPPTVRLILNDASARCPILQTEGVLPYFALHDAKRGGFAARGQEA